MTLRKEGLTIRQLRKQLGAPLTADNFVTTPGPCENPRLFMPFTTVPEHLMSKTQASRAKEALDQCIEVVGPWGELQSKFDTDEFKKPAEEFKKATGVEAKEVFEKVFSNLISDDGCF